MVYDSKQKGQWGRSWGFLRPPVIKRRLLFYRQYCAVIHGHNPKRPTVGDVFHVPMRSGKDAVFKVVGVKSPTYGPDDQFFADCVATRYTDGTRIQFSNAGIGGAAQPE